jgi:hypothetical protein
VLYHAASKSKALRPFFIAAAGAFSLTDRSSAQMRKPMRFEIPRRRAFDPQTTNHPNRRHHSHRHRCSSLRSSQQTTTKFWSAAHP